MNRFWPATIPYPWTRTVRKLDPNGFRALLRGTVVEIQHSSQSLTTPNMAGRACSGSTDDQLVADALVVPLGVVVRHELRHCASKVTLTKHNHPIQALLT